MTQSNSAAYKGAPHMLRLNRTGLNRTDRTAQELECSSAKAIEPPNKRNKTSMAGHFLGLLRYETTVH